jgi:uncharacterized protein (DUF302 family)
MTTKRALQVILAISVFGLTFSGVLSYRELFGAAAACPAPGAAGTVFGYPACVYGFFMYLALCIVAAAGLRAERLGQPGARTARYGIVTLVDLPYAQALERTREELAKQGFGVLTEIDVAATLKKKLDVTFRPYTILGACNPPLAHRALMAEREIGLLLPCNVVVYAADDPGTSVVAVMDPIAALELAANPQIRPIAADARSRLERVLAAMPNGHKA